MLMLLADVLLASAERHSVPQKILRRSKRESWEDVARRFVDSVASSGYQAEEEALTTALMATAVNSKVKRMRQIDLESARLLTDWWVILLVAEDNQSVEADGSALSIFTDQLEADMAEQLAFRTFFVFSANGKLLPLNALKLGAPNIWPAEEDELSKVASGIGGEVMTSVNLRNWDIFHAELLGASRAATLLRMRKQAELPGDEEAFNAQLRSARNAAETCHPLLRGGASRLLSRVEQEPYNDQSTLSGEVYHAVAHANLNDDVNDLTTLRIAALYIDLY